MNEKMNGKAFLRMIKKNGKKMWPMLCQMCGRKFMSARVSGTKYCCGKCGQRYRAIGRRHQIWLKQNQGKTEKEILQK